MNIKNTTQYFLDWWNSGEIGNDNPYKEETPIWWAWEGYLVGINANPITDESSATNKESLSVVKNHFTSAFAIREQRTVDYKMKPEEI